MKHKKIARKYLTSLKFHIYIYEALKNHKSHEMK